MFNEFAGFISKPLCNAPVGNTAFLEQVLQWWQVVVNTVSSLTSLRFEFHSFQFEMNLLLLDQLVALVGLSTSFEISISSISVFC